MTERFDWRGAFSGVPADASPAQRRAVRQAIMDWNSDWTYDTEDGYIMRLEDEDGDGIWDYDYDNAENIGDYFSSEFIAHMDNKFLGTSKSKKPVVIGKATKLPIPGVRP
jgi:hypothetical protein